MTIFQKISEHEQVLFCNDPHTGLKAIIAIHDTTLGPALGGCRMHPYATEEEALQDVLRLSKGMTYKCAAADVDFGGGKAVIIGDPQRDKSPELFRSFGQFVSSLKGRFYTGTDMGTTPEDFVHAYKETECIVGLPEAYGGHGDSSVPTAWGVLQGLRAVCHYLWGSDDLSRRSYAVQGLGKVGFKVAEQLLARGAHLYVTDLDPQVVNRLQKRGAELKGSITPVEGEAIYSVAADIFVPCAIGGIINETNIEQLKVKAVCGSANNQLWTDQYGQLLHERSILYAPDYIVNAGGLIQVADELYGPNKERVKQKTEAIYDTLFQIFVSSEERGISTVEAANQFVEERLWRRARFNNFYSPAEKPKWRVRR